MGVSVNEVRGSIVIKGATCGVVEAALDAALSQCGIRIGDMSRAAMIADGSWVGWLECSGRDVRNAGLAAGAAFTAAMLGEVLS